MKRIFYRILSALIASFAVIICCSCSAALKSDKPVILGTVFPQYDFARQICGDLAQCEMLLRPGVDSHGYTGDDPSDILRIMNCDVFVYVGGETDSEWVEKIEEMIKSSGSEPPIFIALTDVCETIDEDNEGIVDGDEEEEDEFGIEPERDEHVWTSPKNAALAASAICDAVCRVDPENEGIYRSNLKKYTDELEALDSEFKALTDSSDDKTLVFADRFPFRYFANEYGYKCYAAFNGCSSQSEPSPSAVVKLCEIVEDHSLPCVFYIETSNSNVPRLISNATGCKTMLLHSCHTITEGELDSGATYLSLMRQNLITLKEAFSNEK